MQKPAVVFHQEDLNYTLENEEAIVAWFAAACADESSKLGELNYIFCSDKYLHGINMEYLQHDTYTDIITFDYTSPGLISGDVFVSVERVRDNANEFGVAFSQEMHRVLIHGLLHLLGYKDKTEEEQTEMTEREDFYLNLRTFL